MCVSASSARALGSGQRSLCCGSFIGGHARSQVSAAFAAVASLADMQDIGSAQPLLTGDANTVVGLEEKRAQLADLQPLGTSLACRLDIEPPRIVL